MLHISELFYELCGKLFIGSHKARNGTFLSIGIKLFIELHNTSRSIHHFNPISMEVIKHPQDPKVFRIKRRIKSHMKNVIMMEGHYLPFRQLELFKINSILSKRTFKVINFKMRFSDILKREVFFKDHISFNSSCLQGESKH